jgi:hypothetical protein
MKTFWSKLRKILFFYWIFCYLVALSGNSYMFGINRQQWDLTAFSFICVQSLIPSITNMLFVPLVVVHGLTTEHASKPHPDEGLSA